MPAKHRKKLDDSLMIFQDAILALARKVKKAVRMLDETEYSFVDLARATKNLADTTKLLTELAPFFTAKQGIEGSEHLLEWLLHSTDYTGEDREKMLEAVKAYQLEILQDAGFLEKEQYQLL